MNNERKFLPQFVVRFYKSDRDPQNVTGRIESSPKELSLSDHKIVFPLRNGPRPLGGQKWLCTLERDTAPDSKRKGAYIVRLVSQAQDTWRLGYESTKILGCSRPVVYNTAYGDTREIRWDLSFGLEEAPLAFRKSYQDALAAYQGALNKLFDAAKKAWMTNPVYSTEGYSFEVQCGGQAVKIVAVAYNAGVTFYCGEKCGEKLSSKSLPWPSFIGWNERYEYLILADIEAAKKAWGNIFSLEREGNKLLLSFENGSKFPFKDNAEEHECFFSLSDVTGNSHNSEVNLVSEFAGYPIYKKVGQRETANYPAYLSEKEASALPPNLREKAIKLLRDSVRPQIERINKNIISVLSPNGGGLAYDIERLSARVTALATSSSCVISRRSSMQTIHYGASDDEMLPGGSYDAVVYTAKFLLDGGVEIPLYEVERCHLGVDSGKTEEMREAFLCQWMKELDELYHKLSKVLSQKEMSSYGWDDLNQEIYSNLPDSSEESSRMEEEILSILNGLEDKLSLAREAFKNRFMASEGTKKAFASISEEIGQIQKGYDKLQVTYRSLNRDPRGLASVCKLLLAIESCRDSVSSMNLEGGKKALQDSRSWLEEARKEYGALLAQEKRRQDIADNIRAMEAERTSLLEAAMSFPSTVGSVLGSKGQEAKEAPQEEGSSRASKKEAKEAGKQSYIKETVVPALLEACLAQKPVSRCLEILENEFQAPYGYTRRKQGIDEAFDSDARMSAFFALSRARDVDMALEEAITLLKKQQEKKAEPSSVAVQAPVAVATIGGLAAKFNRKR